MDTESNNQSLSRKEFLTIAAGALATVAGWWWASKVSSVTVTSNSDLANYGTQPYGGNKKI